MTDRELLELAAKAVGMQSLPEGVEWPKERIGWFFCTQHGIPTLHDRASMQAWRPLHDDADALRLAVKLGLILVVSRPEVKHRSTIARRENEGSGVEIMHGQDADSATRRAIVCAAAEIGRGE